MTWFSLMLIAVHVTIVTLMGLGIASRIRNSAYRHTILLTVLICDLCSPLFVTATAVSGQTINVPVWSSPSDQAQLAGASEVSDIGAESIRNADLPRKSLDGRIKNAGKDNAAIERVDAANPHSTASDRVTGCFESAALVTWFMGVILFVAALVRSQLKIRSILKTIRQLDSNVYGNVIAGISQQLKIKTCLRIATTGKVPGPMVAGCFRPWILVPSRYLEVLTGDELRQVLLHEGAHAIRRDPLIAVLQRVCTAMLWWHPLIHLLNRQIVRAREEVCDNFVLAHVTPVEYGTTLLKLGTLSAGSTPFPAAIGMFDRQDSLEHRIRDLLDTTRPLQTRVHMGTTVAVLTTFVLVSFAITATRVNAAQRAVSVLPQRQVLNKNTPHSSDSQPVLNAKQFRLVLSYHGSADKPFYNLVLTVPPVAQQLDTFRLCEMISVEQADKIIAHLQASQFFKHATTPANQNDPQSGPQYLLRVSDDSHHFQETLGWDVGTALRLEALLQSFDDHAKLALTRLISRLDGQREIWRTGQADHGLSCRLSNDSRSGVFQSGEPIRIKLELTNSGSEPRSYGQHEFIRGGSEIVVFDERGRHVPYRGGGAGLIQKPMSIAPGETRILEASDISSFYYLRQPGVYTVTFQSSGLPPSNAVTLKVVPGNAGIRDGDPMGKLLQCSSAKWMLLGDPNLVSAIQPGKNRQVVPGWWFMFVDALRGIKGSKAVIKVWLTEKRASDIESSDNDTAETSEYLGQISRWHLYLYASPEALEQWSTLKTDIPAALEGKAVLRDK